MHLHLESMANNRNGCRCKSPNASEKSTRWVWSPQSVKSGSSRTNLSKVRLTEGFSRTLSSIRYFAYEETKNYIRRKCCYFWTTLAYIRHHSCTRRQRSWKRWFSSTQHTHRGWIQLSSSSGMWSRHSWKRTWTQSKDFESWWLTSRELLIKNFVKLLESTKQKDVQDMWRMSIRSWVKTITVGHIWL